MVMASYIYIKIDSPYVRYVQYILQEESIPWGLKIRGKYAKNAQGQNNPASPSNQPNSNHGNKKNDRAHDNMSKKLGWCDRRVISGK